MKGYLHNPEATASAFTGDWLPKNALGKVLKDELAAARPDRP